MLKATFFSIALVAVVGVASPVQADTLEVGDLVTFAKGPAPQADGGGGPFIITGPGDDNSWLTFCLEVDEHMNYSPATFYVGGISNSAHSGGVGGSPDPDHDGEVRDPLDDLTKFIYHEYRTNNGVQGWQGDHVQWAIWMIENEKDLDTGHASYHIYEWAKAVEDYKFKYDVKVINLYTYIPNGPNGGQGTHAQDQLMLQEKGTPTTTGVPEPSSLMLLGSALAAGLVARRRRAAQQ